MMISQVTILFKVPRVLLKFRISLQFSNNLQTLYSLFACFFQNKYQGRYTNLI